MKDTYLVFTIQAYEIMAPDGSLMNSCILELIATNADEALERAKKIIDKPNYRLSRVFENYHDRT